MIEKEVKMKDKSKSDEQNSDTIKYQELLKTLLNVTAEPEKFLEVQDELCNDIKGMLQTVYVLAFTNDERNKENLDILPELVLENMDQEQIWQQVELRNKLVVPQLMNETSRMLNIDEQYLALRLDEEDEDESDEAEGEEEDMDSGELESQKFKSKSKSETGKNGKTKRKGEEKKKMKSKKRSEVEDDFFNLDEMEDFLKAEEAKEEKKNSHRIGRSEDMEDVEIDYFDKDFGGLEFNDESDEEGNNVTYKDFFDGDNDEDEEGEGEEEEEDDQEDGNEDFADEEGENESDSDEVDDEEDESNDDKEEEQCKKDNDVAKNDENEQPQNEADDAPKSSFEIIQARLEQRIKDYENEVLGEKPWQLKGEILASDRPLNSLLGEILEFDAAVQPPSLVTEKTTKCLEDIIKQRIRDKAWDDVERVVRTIKTPQEYRKQLVLDHEKSKLSLAQIYEKEYQNEIAKLDGSANKGNEEEPKEHQEIRAMMHDLFIKLDALSNFHFVPKPVAPEMKIVTNTSAVTMEEVAPVAISDAKLLAPEEVFRGPKHEVIGKSEESKTDKNRARRKKKNKQRAIYKALEAKEERRQKLGIPLTKKEENAKLTKKLTKNRNVNKMVESKGQKAALKSSKAFFNQLQEQKQMAGFKKNLKRPVEESSTPKTAKKFKL